MLLLKLAIAFVLGALQYLALAGALPIIDNGTPRKQSIAQIFMDHSHPLKAKCPKDLPRAEYSDPGWDFFPRPHSQIYHDDGKQKTGACMIREMVGSKATGALLEVFTAHATDFINLNHWVLEVDDRERSGENQALESKHSDDERFRENHEGEALFRRSGYFVTLPSENIHLPQLFQQMIGMPVQMRCKAAEASNIRIIPSQLHMYHDRSSGTVEWTGKFIIKVRLALVSASSVGIGTGRLRLKVVPLAIATAVPGSCDLFSYGAFGDWPTPGTDAVNPTNTGDGEVYIPLEDEKRQGIATGEDACVVRDV
ncbi:hypothetical protein BKA70DRAFT_1241051 [Coprinopsis sp. MPI-PUGE-AT-0042]|nr:hypothetical protein BKA70DRAFT_1241051 [Coprinopsis sp. MPI-PUGE-AT-0042]